MVRYQKLFVIWLVTAIFLGAVASTASGEAIAAEGPDCSVGPDIASDRNAIDRMIAACSAAIEQRPDDAKALTTRGILNYYKGADDAAIADLTHAIAIDPRDGVSWFNRARAHEGKGQYDLAVQDYAHAITLAPPGQENTVRAYRARAFQKAGKLDDALGDYNAVLAQSSRGDAPIVNNRAAVYWQKAVIDYQQAVRLNPNDADLAANLRAAQAVKLKIKALPGDREP
jgi:tetratricopeptide (TPR) repeat protein